VRNILEVQIEVQGEPLWIFVNHWKSRAYHGYESKRMKYAKVLKKRLDRMPTDHPYIVLGDFNTDNDAYFSLEKKIDDTQGKTGLHDVLGVAKNELLTTKSNMIEGFPGQHYSLWGDLHLPARWNTKFYGKKGTPDHIIVSSLLFDKKGIDYVNHSFKVFKKPYLFTKKGYINRWQYKNKKHRGKGYSDHLPIYAYFDTKPYVADLTKKSVSQKREVVNIDYLYSQEHLAYEVILKDVTVIWKHKKHALIKQSKEGRGIFLFSSAKALKIGQKYDLLVRAIKSYKGLKEVTHLRVLKERGLGNRLEYILTQEDLSKKISHRQNEIFENLEGVYKNGHFTVEDRKFSIYFKKKNSKPKNGSKLKIHKALLGYYKQLQLVVYDPKDFTVLEK